MKTLQAFTDSLVTAVHFTIYRYNKRTTTNNWKVKVYLLKYGCESGALDFKWIQVFEETKKEL